MKNPLKGMMAVLSVLVSLLMQTAPQAATHSNHKGGGENLLAACQGKSALPSADCGQVPTPAFDANGALWLAFVQQGHVYITRSDDLGKGFTPPRAINGVPERIYSDGENRPKLAIGPAGELYVSWTRKIEGKYAGDIRFSRSLDGGRSFSQPLTVNDDHAPISHRFDAMQVDDQGDIYLAWIDKRDLSAAKAEGKPYSGAAIYYAVSQNRGDSFAANRKLADHSCECCRIAMDLDTDGLPVALWRHVYPVNLRDHAIARLTVDGPPIEGMPAKATDDGWIIEGCPHHGPDMAVDQQNRAHMVWFTQGEKNRGLVYGRFDLTSQQIELQHQVDATSSAARPQVAVLQGGRVLTAWKRFNGIATELVIGQSDDQGEQWSAARVIATTANGSDHPVMLQRGDQVYISWHTLAEGYRLLPVL